MLPCNIVLRKKIFQVLNLSGGELQRVALTLALGTVSIYNDLPLFICYL